MLRWHLKRWGPSSRRTPCMRRALALPTTCSGVACRNILPLQSSSESRRLHPRCAAGRAWNHGALRVVDLSLPSAPNSGAFLDYVVLTDLPRACLARVVSRGPSSILLRLIMPVQRVPRYRLLLSELLKHVSPVTDRHLHDRLTAALTSVEVAAEHVNERVHYLHKLDAVREVSLVAR